MNDVRFANTAEACEERLQEDRAKMGILAQGP